MLDGSGADAHHSGTTMDRPRFDTVALVKLRAWLGSGPGRNQARLAAAVGVDRSACSRWRAGISRPSVGTQREAVRFTTQIPVDDWLTDEERAADAEKLRRAAIGVPVEPAQGAT